MTELAEEIVVDGETGELLRYEPRQQVTLFGTNDPEEVVAAATVAAKPLAQAVREQGLVVQIRKGEHVRVEGWTMLGSMLGVFAVADGDPEPVEIDGAFGFKASMKAVTRSGDVVGGGTSYCMRSESDWRNADVYALAGMAQTRATSRALRQPLGFVMKLAGFSPTPAEEMPSQPNSSAVAKKDKAPAMRTRIKELAVEADTQRGDTKTAAEIEATVKVNWDTSLAKLGETELGILGTDLKQWLEDGCKGEFKVLPF